MFRSLLLVALCCLAVKAASTGEQHSKESFSPLGTGGDPPVVSDSSLEEGGESNTESPSNSDSTETNDSEELVDELKNDANALAADNDDNGEQSDDGGEEEKDEITDFKDDDEVKAASLRSFIRLRPYVLTRYVNRLVTRHLRNQPVVKMLAIGMGGGTNRPLSLYRVNGYTFHHSRITTINMRYYNRASGNSILVYRPRYRDYHGSLIGAVFVNMERLFPCIRRSRVRRPICRMFTNEEDGFNHGQALVEVGDSGNNLGMFRRRSIHYSTYGFGFSGCRVLNQQCLPQHYMATIVCHLPRAYCS